MKKYSLYKIRTKDIGNNISDIRNVIEIIPINEHITEIKTLDPLTGEFSFVRKGDIVVLYKLIQGHATFISENDFKYFSVQDEQNFPQQKETEFWETVTQFSKNSRIRRW